MFSITHLLQDLLDIEDIRTWIDAHCTNIIDFREILTNDPRAHANLMFHEMFFEVMGTYPHSGLVKEFLTSETFDTKRFAGFMTNAFPLLQGMTFDDAVLRRRLDLCKAQDPQRIFLKKLEYRYNVPLDLSSSLVQNYKRCWKSNILQDVCDALAQHMSMATLKVPAFKSMHQYLDFQNAVVAHFHLHTRNPFDGLATPHFVKPHANARCTVFDVLSKWALHPSVVVRLVARNVVATDDAMLSNKLFPNFLRIVPGPQSHIGGPLAYHHPTFVKYFPRIAASFVCMTKTSLEPPLSRDPQKCLTSGDSSSPNYSAKISLEVAADAYWVLGTDKLLQSLHKDVIHSTIAQANISLFHQFLLRYYHQHQQKIKELFRPNDAADNTVLIIETRKNLWSVMSLLTTFANLQPGAWACNVVCCSDNLEFFKDALAPFDKANTVRYTSSVPNTKFDLDDYNNMFKDATFWKMWQSYKRVLVIQDDGMLIRPGLEKSPCFHCDYVGAPWKASLQGNDVLGAILKGRLVGNGGLSLRNPNVMMRVCEMYASQKNYLNVQTACQQEPEDVFFSRLVHNVPSVEVAARFSSEQILCHESLGFHKPWPYHAPENLVEYFNSALAPQFQIKIARRMGMTQ